MRHIVSSSVAIHESERWMPARQEVSPPRLEATMRDAAEVAAHLGTAGPLLCLAPRTLHDRARRFMAGFPGAVSYAVKANPDDLVVTILADAGIGCFDVASLHEMDRVRRLVPDARLHYHNPVKAREEIAGAYHRFGVRRFAVDHERELAKIAQVTGRDPSVEVAVRLRLPGRGAAVHDFSSKFGASPEEATPLLRQVAEFGFAPVLTFHPGSLCLDPSAYADHIAAAGRIARQAGIGIEALNVGGGFPVPYPGLDVPPLEAFFTAIAEAARRAFGPRPPRLEAEPGRALVAEAASLLATVKLVKPETAEIYLTDGLYGTLMELGQTPHVTPLVRAVGRQETSLRPFTVYGPTCDPLDRLPHPVPLPEDIAEGDHLEFGNMGAYGQATATRFNGYGRIEIVLVSRPFGGGA